MKPVEIMLIKANEANSHGYTAMPEELRRLACPQKDLYYDEKKQALVWRRMPEVVMEASPSYMYGSQITSNQGSGTITHCTSMNVDSGYYSHPDPLHDSYYDSKANSAAILKIKLREHELAMKRMYDMDKDMYVEGEYRCPGVTTT